MSPLTQWLLIAPAIFLAMVAAWAWQRRHANMGIVDVVWALGMGASAIFIAATGQGLPSIRAALGLLAGIWSLRLAWHLWRRVRQAEDGRYRALRQHWDGRQDKIFGLFMLQAGLVMLLGLPFLAVGMNPHAGPHLLVGILIGAAALTGEISADLQLDRFRNNPANHGRTCRNGLWRYSRHPNYFFEWCHGFAYVALAWGSPLHWLAWLGPVMMYVFLRWISGIPFTEQQALRSRGEDYQEYQRATPAFFPWFPKRSNDEAQP